MTTPWYTSKTLWAAVASFLAGVPPIIDQTNLLDLYGAKAFIATNVGNDAQIESIGRTLKLITDEFKARIEDHLARMRASTRPEPIAAE